MDADGYPGATEDEIDQEIKRLHLRGLGNVEITRLLKVRFFRVQAVIDFAREYNEF